MKPLCDDCQADLDQIREFWYMVLKDVWPGDPHGLLCIGCLESRLGRRLTPADFFDCLCSWGISDKSDRLKDRMDFDRLRPERIGLAYDHACMVLEKNKKIAEIRRERLKCRKGIS